MARECGALVQLQFALNFYARSQLSAGELTEVAVVVEEERAIAQPMGNAPVGYEEMQLEAWRGQEAVAAELIESMVRTATARGFGRMVDVATYAKALLYNGLGRYDAAREAAQAGFEHREHLGSRPFIVAELAEAASRTGTSGTRRGRARVGVGTNAVTRTDWALGIEARVRALLSVGDAAESAYRESIARLGRTRLRMELARAHLLYGEWLRRERRRVDAREHLRTAHERFKRSAPRRSPSAPGTSCSRPARRSASAATTRAMSSRRRRSTSRGSPSPGGPTRRSAPSCSSARAPWSGI